MISNKVKDSNICLMDLPIREILKKVLRKEEEFSNGRTDKFMMGNG